VGNHLFVEHLSYLNRLEGVDIALLYLSLERNQPWPQCNGEPLSPIALIVFAATMLVKRLAPDSEALEHPELATIGHCVGAMLYQLTAIATIADVASAPAIFNEKSADGAGEGVRRVGLDIAQVLSMTHDMSAGTVIVEEVEDGETEAAASRN